MLADLALVLNETGDSVGAKAAFANSRQIIEHIASHVNDEALRSTFINSQAVQQVLTVVG